MQKDVLDLIVEELLLDMRRFKHMTPRQLAMVLNAAARLQIFEPRLIEALAAQVRLCARGLDAQSLCIIANACARLPSLGVETFQTLYVQVPRHLSRLSGRQLAMLCHAWARAHVHNDDLFALMALPLVKHAGSLSAYEVALCVYGYAHFKKSPPELFGPLLHRFVFLLGNGKVVETELLMLGNALGRVGWQDASVATALRRYLSDIPGRSLPPATMATFRLMHSDDDLSVDNPDGCRL